MYMTIQIILTPLTLFWYSACSWNFQWWPSWYPACSWNFQRWSTFKIFCLFLEFSEVIKCYLNCLIKLIQTGLYFCVLYKTENWNDEYPLLFSSYCFPPYRFLWIQKFLAAALCSTFWRKCQLFYWLTRSINGSFNL